MAIERAASNTWLTGLTADATSFNKAFAVDVTAGSLLVAVTSIVGNDVGTSATMTDTQSNTWTLAATYYMSLLTGTLSVWYAENAAAGATTVTTASSLNQDRFIAICEYKGAATSSPVDGSIAQDFNTSGTVEIDPGPITSTGDAVFIGAAITTSVASVAENTGYTRQYAADPGGAWYPVRIEDAILSGAQTSSPKWTDTLQYWCAIGVAFKAASGGASIVPILNHHRMMQRRSCI
jgi:hypothetical protein